MWKLDPNPGEGPQGASTPILLPSEAANLCKSPILPPQPVLVPNVQGLKQQFQEQQSLLAHIKETLRENDQDRSAKAKLLEMNDKKLKQIKSRYKKKAEVQSTPSKSLPRRSSKENLAGPQIKKLPNEGEEKCDESDKKTLAKENMSELKKRLEENKIKFKEGTEKGLKIETMVEKIRTQVQERDVTIHELQKTMDTPPTRPKPKVQTLPRRLKETPVVISKWTQTQNAPTEKNDIKKGKEQDAIILELQNALQQKAVQKKSISDNLEVTRQEMRDMQGTFSAVEHQLKTELVEKDKTLEVLDEKLMSLESLNEKLTTRNSEIETRLTEMSAEKEALMCTVKELQSSGFVSISSGAQVPELEKKLEELRTELDDSNKLTIRLKLEHKKKLKAANQALDKLKQSSDDKAEIHRLLAKVEELESTNSKLDGKIAELEEEKASSNADKLKNQELDGWLKEKDLEIQRLQQQLDTVEDEKKILQQNIEDQNILVDNLNARIQMLQPESNLEPFEIPGDAAAKQFDLSNETVQGQIESLVKEKQELLDKLKNLSGIESTGSFTFEKIEDVEPEIMMLKENVLTSPLGTSVNVFNADSNLINELELSLAEEKAKSVEYEAKISNLESTISTLEKSTHLPKGSGSFRNKLKKLENELKREKARNDELIQSLAAKEELIQVLNDKLTAAEENRIADDDGGWGMDPINISETQQKCLSLESTLLQLTEQCEHLRKENIEVVHQLSGEKVRRIRAEEEAEDVRAAMEAALALEIRVAALEKASSETLEGGLEYANIVIASKDTEIFKLQRSLAEGTQMLDNAKEELQNLKTEIEELRMKFSTQSSEISQLQMNLVNAEVELENRKLAIIQLQDCISEGRQRTSVLERQLEDQASVSESRLKDLSCEIQSKSDECANLKAERHRLQVSLDSLMSEVAIAAQERSKSEDKLNQLEKALHGEQLKTQNIEVLVRQREEALLKAEETEKVLQTTWAERNDLIQSREAIYQRLGEAEHKLGLLAAQKDEAVRNCEELRRNLEQVNVDDHMVAKLNEQLTKKDKELKEVTRKAKMLVANLKKKVEAEKVFEDVVKSLNLEKEELIKQLSQGNEIAESRDSILQEQRKLLVENEKLITQYSIIQQEKDALVVQINCLNQEIENYKIEGDHKALALYNEKMVLEEIIAKEKEIKEEILSQYNGVLSENDLLKENLTEVEEKWTLEKSEKESVQQLQARTAGELNALQQAFELEEQENQALMSQKAVMLQEKEELSNKYQEALVRVKSLEEEHSNLTSELEKLSNLLKAAAAKEAEFQRLEISMVEEKNTLDEQLRQKDNMLDENKSHINELNKTISELKSTILLLEEETKTMLEQRKMVEEQTNAEIEQYKTTVAHLQKQLNNFNLAFDAEVQKNASLKAEIEGLHSTVQQLESEVQRLTESSRAPIDTSERKKKKSVTFKTDEVDYIKELKGEVADLQRALVESDATVGELKAALVVKENVDSAVHEPQVTSKTFNVNLFDEPPGGDFFSEMPNPEPVDPFSEDSLAWDDGWGTEGQLEQEHAISKSSLEPQDPDKLAKLEAELRAVHADKESVQEDLGVLQVKYSKVVKKLKEQKLVIDRLQAEVRNAKKSSNCDDLDAALLEEMRSEMAKVEAKEKEARKELEVANLEKASLLKRIDVLNAGNERFVEMKEIQDNEAASWQNKIKELRAQISDLQTQQLASSPDDSELIMKNRELENQIEGLEWKVSELTEMVEEKDEQLKCLSTQPIPDQNNGLSIENLEKELALKSESLQTTVEKLRDVENQLNMLAVENEELQSILNDKTLSPKAAVKEPSALSQWFPMDSSQPFVAESHAESQDLAVKEEEWRTLNATLAEEIKHLKDQLNLKDQEIQKLSNELAEIGIQAKIEEGRIISELRSKEEEISALVKKLQETEKSYEEARAEIERLLSESQLESDSPLEEELANANRLIESEKTRYESLLKARDVELTSLRDSLGNVERDWDETQDRNDGTVQQLKAQLRDLDASAAHAMEEKEMEVRELRVECEELRGLCTTRDNEISSMRSQLSSKDAHLTQIINGELADVHKLLAERSAELQMVQNKLNLQEIELKNVRQLTEQLRLVQQRLATKEQEVAALSSSEVELLSRDAEVRELRAELFTRDAEIRELRSSLQGLHDEVSQFRNFDKQLLDLRTSRTVQSATRDWNAQEVADLASRLQSDLDTALNTIYHRDVRCDELTFELTRLVEERDTLQLRLSNALRQNEEMRTQLMAPPLDLTRSPPREQATGERDTNLANKISELRTIGYGRDKNYQDDSQQRHREQIALLSRDTKTIKEVFDV